MSTLGEFDYVVCGGGSAGCIVAARLAEDPNVTVCLLEAGPAYENDPVVLGFEDDEALTSDSKYGLRHPVAAQSHGNSRAQIFLARMLGGCSSHNSAVAWRAFDRDLAAWEALGATGWGAEDVAPAFDRLFAKINLAEVPGKDEVARAAHEAAIALGVPEVVTNAGDIDQGAAWYQVNARSGVRHSSAVAYLYPLADLPPNLAVRTESWVERIVLEAGSAIGVIVGGELIRARREVIVSLGAIGTPKALMLSGIGPADHLREVGIDVRHDLPGVGQRLQDHCEVSVIYELDRPPGPSFNGSENGIFVSSGVQGGPFDIYIHAISGFYYHDAGHFGFAEPPRNAFTFTPNAARPKSEGSIRLADAGPRSEAIVDPGYLSDPDGTDLEVLVRGVNFVRRLAQQERFEAMVVRELMPGPALVTDAEIAMFVRTAHASTHHPAGSCRMGGVEDERAVVDPRLRVRGVDRLRIADASVFPRMLPNNIGATVLMIGERCAELIRADHRSATA